MNKTLLFIAFYFLSFLANSFGQCNSGNNLSLFWRAGSGDFNDPNRWEVGAVGSNISPCQSPRSGDDVTFPASAFAVATTITVNQNANCNIMYWQPGAAIAPVFTGTASVNLDIYGSLELATNLTFNFNGNLRFKSVAAAGMVHDIQLQNKDLYLYSFVIEPSSDVEYRLLSELRLFRPTGPGTSAFTGGSIFFNSGHFNTNAQKVRAEGFTSITGNAGRKLNISGSQIEVVRNDRFSGLEWTAWNVDFNRNIATPNIASIQAAGSHIFVNNTGMSWVSLGRGVKYDSISFGPADAVVTVGSYVSGVADTFHYIAAHRRVGGEPWTCVTEELHLYPNALVSGAGTLNLTVEQIITHGGCGSFPTLGSIGVSIRGAGNGWNGTTNLTKRTAGVLLMQNLLVGRVVANTTGGRTYTANNCGDKGGNTNVNFIAGPTNELYFRDNANNQDWHTLSNWERWDGTSFSAATCTPTPFDNVYFDGASFPNTIKRVNINANGTCKAMRWLPTVSSAANIRMNAGYLSLFGSLEWSAAMTTSSFYGNYSVLMCSPNQDSIITNGAINNSFYVSLENNADYHIHGNFTGRIWGGPNSQLRMAAHELRPTVDFNFSRANFNGTQIYTNTGVNNGCAAISYTGAATWHFLPIPAGTVGYAWVCTLPEVIMYPTSSYYIYNGTINILGNLNIQEDARFMLGTPNQYAGSLNVVGGLNGAAGNVTVNRGGELSFVNFTNSSSRIAGSFNLLGDCQKTASLLTQNGQILSGGFRVAGAVNIQNAYIRGINNTSLAPNVLITTTNTLDAGNNSNFTFVAPSSQTYYWRARNGSPTVFAGSWATAGHWTTNPANLTGDNSCVPSGFDDVVFDALSFSGTSNGCSITAPSFCRDIFMRDAARLVVAGGSFSCRNFDISHSNAITESSDINQQINISQSLTLATNMPRMNYRGTIQFSGSGNIHSNGTRLEARMLNFNNPTGIWQLQDELYLANDWAGTNGVTSVAGELRITAGQVYTNSHNVTISSFFNASIGTANRGFHMDSSIIRHRIRAPHQGNGTAKWAWNINPTNFSLSSNAGAQIIFGPNTLYNGNASTRLDFFMGNGLTYPKVTLIEDEQPMNLYGNTNYRYLVLQGNVYTDGNNAMDSLRLEGGYFYSFRNASTQTLNAPHGKIISNGTSSNFVNIESSAAGQPFTLRKPFGPAFCLDFVKVKDCVGTKETNMALVPTTPTNYQLIQPFLEFQTGVNSDNIGGTATGIWAFNLPVLVTPQYAGANIVQPCAVIGASSFNVPVTGTGPYLVNYTWNDGGSSGSNVITAPDDDNNSSTPAFIAVPIHSGNASISYTFNITTFRCGEETAPVTRNIIVQQTPPNILTQTVQNSVCDFNNSANWQTMVGNIDARPIVSLQDYTGPSDMAALGSVTTNVFFDATVQQVNIGGFMYPYLQRHWRITPTNNGPANIRLYFTQAELNALIAAAGSTYGAFTNASQLQVVRYASGTIGVGPEQIIPYTITPLVGAAAAPFSSTANVYCFEFAVPSFSHFILTPSTTILLSNNLLTFEAEKQTERAALLTWTVEKSNETRAYRIERSRDGVQFYALVEVASHRQSGRDSYIFTDLQPMQGDNYYRIVALDDDGSQDRSPSRVLDFGNTIKGISIAPNPANDYVDIRLENAAEIEVRVYNQLGQMLVNQQFTTAGNQYRIDISSLPSAAYQVQILQANGSSKTYTIVKK
jgi:hypothetical protein